MKIGKGSSLGKMMKAEALWRFAAMALALSTFSTGARAQQCLFESCAHDGKDAKELSVYSPVPPSVASKPIRSAPRLSTLEGKTIAIVGGSFMAKVTHPELKKLILAEFPTAKIYLLDEIGAAGPFPRPGVTRREKVAFQERLRDFGVDAVIAGNGGCGLCTPREAGSCIAAEEIGIPSVMIAATGFVEQAKSAARDAGLAVLAIAEYKGSFAAEPRETLLEKTRTSLWPQIKAALTGEQTKAGAAQPAEPAAAPSAQIITGTPRQLEQIFLDSGWTDGLPINFPTEELVNKFLKFTDLAPDFQIGTIPPAMHITTVRDVAVNAAMSGCPPEFMPLALAFTEAMMDGNFRRPLASTHAWTPYCWLNGPIVAQLGLDCGQGEISAARNAAFGRFINLAMLNLGGYKIKENRMGTFGYLMPWCLAENDEATRAVGWLPHNEQLGYKKGVSTLTAASAVNWGNNLVPATVDAERIKDLIAYDATEKSQMAVRSGMPCTYRVFLITPGVAKNLAGRYKTKRELEDAVVAAARIPLDERAFANYWGNPGSAFDPETYTIARHRMKISRTENAARTPTPPWLDWTGFNTLPTVPAMERGKSAFIVTGDPSRNKVLCVPGGATKTIAIKLPADWERLLKEK